LALYQRREKAGWRRAHSGEKKAAEANPPTKRRKKRDKGMLLLVRHGDMTAK